MFIKPVIKFESLMPPCAAAESQMGDHESDGLEYQDDEEAE